MEIMPSMTTYHVRKIESTTKFKLSKKLSCGRNVFKFGSLIRHLSAPGGMQIISKTAPPSPSVSKKSMISTECIHQTPSLAVTRHQSDVSSLTVSGNLSMDKRFSLTSTDCSTREQRSTSPGSSPLDPQRKKGSLGNMKPPIITVNNSTAPQPKSKSNVKFHKLFDVEEDETLIKSFACALVDEILYQGTFYASENYFCFYAKIASKRKLIKLTLDDVVNITRQKTAGIIPNAIALHTKDDRLLFTSFMSRDSAFRCMTELLEQKRQVGGGPLSWDPLLNESSDDADAPVAITLPSRYISAVNKQPLMPAPEDNQYCSDLEKMDPPTMTSSSNYDKPRLSQDGGIKAPRSPNLVDDSDFATKQSRNSPTNKNSSDGTKFDWGGFKTSQDSSDPAPNLPKVHAILAISYFTLILLSGCAVVLAYRVHTLQFTLMDRFGSHRTSFAPHGPYSFASAQSELKCQDDASCHLYHLRHTLHINEVSRIHATLVANINHLDGMLRSLRHQNFPPPSQEPPPSPSFQSFQTLSDSIAEPPLPDFSAEPPLSTTKHPFPTTQASNEPEHVEDSSLST